MSGFGLKASRSAGGGAKCGRWNPTNEQVKVLTDLFRSGLRTPTTDQIQKISSQLSFYGKIESKNVFYWFQNHKARERQKRRRVYVEYDQNDHNVAKQRKFRSGLHFLERFYHIYNCWMIYNFFYFSCVNRFCWSNRHGKGDRDIAAFSSELEGVHKRWMQRKHIAISDHVYMWNGNGKSLSSTTPFSRFTSKFHVKKKKERLNFTVDRVHLGNRWANSFCDIEFSSNDIVFVLKLSYLNFGSLLEQITS